VLVNQQFRPSTSKRYRRGSHWRSVRWMGGPPPPGRSDTGVKIISHTGDVIQSVQSCRKRVTV